MDFHMNGWHMFMTTTIDKSSLKCADPQFAGDVHVQQLHRQCHSKAAPNLL